MLFSPARDLLTQGSNPSLSHLLRWQAGSFTTGAACALLGEWRVTSQPVLGLGGPSAASLTVDKENTLDTVSLMRNLSLTEVIIVNKW